MNPHLRDRILRQLETLSDERGYQVLDYVEFISSRYAEKPQSSASLFTKFTEGVEDRLRAGKVSATTIAETMSLMTRAVGMLEGVAAAGKSVANDVMSAARTATTPSPGATPGAATPGAPAPGAPTSAAQPTTPPSAAPSPSSPPSPAAGDQPS
jgi:hypothetical protein